ncbi:MAG: tRNA (adenosine(37)-N6)-dimethylallyltransferase MiaA, partial [Akkermansiaceae bacterium]
MPSEHCPLNTLFLCGPTASGKSSAALALARACDGEIVNADAFQLYRGLATLTAAPSEEERTVVPHHLYGVIDPAHSLDAASFRNLALPVLSEIEARGKRPLVVGGSGLYLKFLTHGPNDLPTADPKLRAELEALSLDELNRRLEELDPVEAARIDHQNPRYVQRALEVCLLTGRPVSEQRDSFEIDTSHLRGVVLTWEPAPLEERIRRRAKAMLEGGAIEEVAALPNLGATAAKAIGVPEIRSYLAGASDRESCEEQ